MSLYVTKPLIKYLFCTRLTLAYAQFLKVSKNKPSALAKFIRVAKDNAITSSTGWNARIEAAKLILVDHEGKSKNKARIFNWLNEMITYNGKNLFIPFILLGKGVAKKK
jgi:hypothetical protein